MEHKSLVTLASAGLAVGAMFGLAGTLAPSGPLRGLAWGIDGSALVMAAALLTIHFYRKGDDLVAAGFLVFAMGQVLVLSGAAMDLAASVPGFGAGVALWSAGLALISLSRAFHAVVRLLGFLASAMFAVTALQVFAGAAIGPLSFPLPSLAYPLLVATIFGWIHGLWSATRHGVPAG